MASLSTIRRDDRGQLLLVGAFILAVLLVALAVVLNAAVYTETYAARGNDRVDVSDTVQYRADTERALTGVVASVNENATASRNDTEATLRAGVTDWDAVSARQQAATGRATSVAIENVTVQTNVSQTNGSLSFTNASDESNWGLFQTVDSTQTFAISVNSTATTVDASNVTNLTVLEGEAFHVEIKNSTGTSWQVFVFQSPWNASDATVVVHSDGSFTTYDVSQSGIDTVEIDLVAGTVDGVDDPTLAPIDVRSVTFENGDRAAGTYEIVVDDDVVNTSDYTLTPADGPTARAVVTAVDVTLRYEMPNLEYETLIRVTGGSDV